MVRLWKHHCYTWKKTHLYWYHRCEPFYRARKDNKYCCTIASLKKKKNRTPHESRRSSISYSLIIDTIMIRTPCPTCLCWFKKNRDIAPHITSSWIHQSLQKIRSKKALSHFFNENNIRPFFEEDEWHFWVWICLWVVNKFRKKIQELAIDSPRDWYILHDTDIVSWETDFLSWKIPWRSDLEVIHNDE